MTVMERLNQSVDRAIMHAMPRKIVGCAMKRENVQAIYDAKRNRPYTDMDRKTLDGFHDWLEINTDQEALDASTPPLLYKEAGCLSLVEARHEGNIFVRTVQYALPSSRDEFWSDALDYCAARVFIEVNISTQFAVLNGHHR